MNQLKTNNMDKAPKDFWSIIPNRKTIAFLGAYQDEMMTITESGGKNEILVPLYIVMYDNAYDSCDVKVEMLTAMELQTTHSIDIEQKMLEKYPEQPDFIFEQLIDFPTKPCKGPNAPTVQDVIDTFMKVKDKTLPVFGYLEETEKDKGNSIDIILLESIDVSMDDRIDINMTLSD